ncbi:hypothetical protein ACDF64_04495 [Agromyces sp. MMS24-JH15]|uniref:hypothetical protein n=1 Tax=Agromyces sp. MMS24-JH15 TaxID=3243765 RepID=UPI00374945EC
MAAPDEVRAEGCGIAVVAHRFEERREEFGLLDEAVSAFPAVARVDFAGEHPFGFVDGERLEGDRVGGEGHVLHLLIRPRRAPVGRVDWEWF